MDTDAMGRDWISQAHFTNGAGVRTRPQIPTHNLRFQSRCIEF